MEPSHPREGVSPAAFQRHILKILPAGNTQVSNVLSSFATLHLPRADRQPATAIPVSSHKEADHSCQRRRSPLLTCALESFHVRGSSFTSPVTDSLLGRRRQSLETRRTARTGSCSRNHLPFSCLTVVPWTVPCGEKKDGGSQRVSCACAAMPSQRHGPFSE